jgi:hypothetical protein
MNKHKIGPFKNITEIKKANREIGRHFFDNIAHDNSIKTLPKVYGGGLFIERVILPFNNKAVYRVRLAHESGACATLGQWISQGKYYLQSIEEAKQAVKRILDAGLSFKDCKSLNNFYF